MDNQAIITSIWENHNRQLQGVVPSYRRGFYDEFKLDTRCKGIVGARGVGKTTFLINYIRENYREQFEALYVSADHYFFSEYRLFELVEYLDNNYPIKLVCIDEIHKYQDWNQELKNIYDSFPGLKIIFSGSSAVDLIEGKYDLSRRVVLEQMPGLSFREYLEIQTAESFPVVSLNEIFTQSKLIEKITKTPRILGYFKDYLRYGYYTLGIELKDQSVYLKTIKGIIEKTVYQDIANFYSIKSQNLISLIKLLYFFSTAKPGSININKLSKSLGKDHSTISEYIQILQNTSMLNFLSNDQQGHALIRNAEKIYISNPNLIYSICQEIGKDPDIGLIRETFLVNQLKSINHGVFFSKIGDFLIDKKIVEVGGKSKTNQQIKGVKDSYLVLDDILISSENKIPLFLFGFLY